MIRWKMSVSAYAIVTTLLTLLGLVGLLSLRVVGLYSHQALAVVLLLGCGWAVASRVWLAWKGRLYLRLLRGFRGRDSRTQLLQAVGRASFWVAASAACLAVFPRSAEMTPLCVALAGVCVLRIAASFLTSHRTNTGPTLVMVAGALVLVFDLGRAFIGSSAAGVQIASPFQGKWLVLQGGRSPLQSHHLVAYNQRFALDLVRLENGHIFGDETGNAAVHSWEQPLRSPVDGKVVVARDDMEDAEGANFVTDTADAAGNVIVIELDTGLFVVLAHLRHGTLRVSEGDRVRKGDPKDLEDVDAELRELVARKILVGQDAFEFKVPLFFRWLRDRGVHDIIASFDVLDHYTLTRRHEAKQQIASDELLALTSSWSHYRGQHITDDRVRAWLAQFSGAQEQRLAFTILQKLKCYSNGLVREKLRELDAVVGRKITSRTISGRKRSDLLISYLDGVGKSGAHCASLYAEEAGVYVGNVVERGRIAEKLMARDDIRGLVFVDDFIGTGESVSGYMNSLNKPLVELVKKLKLPVVIVGVAACTEGQRRLEEVKESWPIEVDLFIGESLDESFRCFGDASAVFSESEERAAAKTMALRYGKTLEKKCPLGYGDLELAVVFERGCPNNSLPMLWSRSSRWTPLFPRD